MTFLATIEAPLRRGRGSTYHGNSAGSSGSASRASARPQRRPEHCDADVEAVVSNETASSAMRRWMEVI